MVPFFEAVLDFLAPLVASVPKMDATTAEGAKFYSTARVIAINPGLSLTKKGARLWAPFFYYFQLLNEQPRGCRARIRL